jgi:hypothetical protein
MSKLNPAVVAGIADALRSAGVDPAVPLAKDAAPSVAKDLIERLASDPAVVNATNSEPWYQSRVTLGAIGALISTAGGVGVLVQQGVTDVNAYIGPVTAFVFAGIVLYGRLKGSLAPLGGKG